MGSPSTDPRPGQTSANGRGAWTNRKAQACLGRTLSAGQDRPARSSPCHDSWGSTGTGSRRRACTPHSCQSFGGTNSSAQTGRRSSCSHRKPRGHTRWRRAGRSSTGRDMDRAGRGWSFAGCSPLSQTGRTCAARARPPGGMRGRALQRTTIANAEHSRLLRESLFSCVNHSLAPV